jgi:hypothetical protein
MLGTRRGIGGMSNVHPETGPQALANTPEAALNLLIEGNERYVANAPRERDFSAGRASRAPEPTVRTRPPMRAIRHKRELRELFK